jgi:hypothetical protein
MIFKSEHAVYVTLLVRCTTIHELLGTICFALILDHTVEYQNVTTTQGL